jgi:hypothetical protein
MFGMGAQAESLRCNGQSVEVGNSRLSLLHKCGEPVLKDSFCAPVYTYPTYQLNPVPLVGPGVPCLPVDEWLYDRGPGNLMATVRLQSGVVRSITYSRQPG